MWSKCSYILDAFEASEYLPRLLHHYLHKIIKVPRTVTNTLIFQPINTCLFHQRRCRRRFLPSAVLIFTITPHDLYSFREFRNPTENNIFQYIHNGEQKFRTRNLRSSSLISLNSGRVLAKTLLISVSRTHTRSIPIGALFVFLTFHFDKQ